MSTTARRSVLCSIRLIVPLSRSLVTVRMIRKASTASVADRHAEAAVILPPRSTAVLSETAETEPTQRDCYLQLIARTVGSGGRRRQGTTSVPASRLQSDFTNG